MIDKVTLLVVEDNDADFRLVSESLKESPIIFFEAIRAERLSDAVKMIEERKFNAALLDLDLPDSAGLSIVDKIYNCDPGMALLVLTGIDDERTGIEAVKKGAQDYLVKGSIHGGLLYRAVRYAIERKRAEDIVRRDKETLERLVQERTQALVEAQVELERAKRLSDIGTLSATVAHELRNPLAAITIAAHNIKKKALNSDFDRHLMSIEKKVFESEQIISNLLFYSRLKSPHYESLNVSGLLLECVDGLKDKGAKRVLVEKDLDPITDVLIEADSGQVREVFNNLLNNAYDAIPSENGWIRIRADQQDGFIEVTVHDYGSGIEKDILEKIFDPFYTTKAKGTGLGLSVCQQIIRMHNGSIDVESTPGQGTSFIVKFPINAGGGGKIWLLKKS